VNYSTIFTRFALFISLVLSAVISMFLAKEHYAQWYYYDSVKDLEQHTTWVSVAAVLVTLAFGSFAWTWKALRD
jgi:hypothetical protein